MKNMLGRITQSQINFLRELERETVFKSRERQTKRVVTQLETPDKNIDTKMFWATIPWNSMSNTEISNKYDRHYYTVAGKRQVYAPHTASVKRNSVKRVRNALQEGKQYLIAKSVVESTGIRMAGYKLNVHMWQETTEAGGIRIHIG